MSGNGQSFFLILLYRDNVWLGGEWRLGIGHFVQTRPREGPL